MWCKRLCFIYIVVGLVAAIASAAPSGKRKRNANEKQFVKVEIGLLPKDHAHDGVGGGDKDDTEYYPTIDVSVSNETSHEHPAASNKKKEEDGKGGFKTICDDEGPGSKCSESEETIEQLLSKITTICEKQEPKELQELVDKLAGKVHELQNSCGGEASKGRHLSGVVHKHTVEQEVVKIEEHEDDDGSEAKDEKVPPPMPENAVPPAPPQVATPVEGPPTLPPLDFLDGYPADVNFNGGMNQPIDVLKQLYPEGHWPDEPEKGDVNSAESGVAVASLSMPSSGETSSNLETVPVYVDSKPKEEDKEEEEYDEDNYDYDYENKDPSLTPEYLESIIRNEQSFPQTENHQQRQHHRQEHELLMDD